MLRALNTDENSAIRDSTADYLLQASRLAEMIGERIIQRLSAPGSTEKFDDVAAQECCLLSMCESQAVNKARSALSETVVPVPLKPRLTYFPFRDDFQPETTNGSRAENTEAAN